MAYGGNASMCAGHISLVSSLAFAIRAFGLDGAAHHLDSQHHPDLLRLAFADARSSVVGSLVDYAAGVRIRSNGRRNYLVSQVHTTRGNARLNGLASLCRCGLQTANLRHDGRERISMHEDDQPGCAV